MAQKMELPAMVLSTTKEFFTLDVNPARRVILFWHINIHVGAIMVSVIQTLDTKYNLLDIETLRPMWF